MSRQLSLFKSSQFLVTYFTVITFEKYFNKNTLLDLEGNILLDK